MIRRRSVRESDRRGWFCAENTVGSVETVHGEKSSQNSWFQAKKRQIRQRSNRIWWDLARSCEISLDLDEISLDLLDKSPKYENLLLESENLKLESGNLRPEYGKSRRILEISTRFWKFLLEILSTSVGSGFFRFWGEKLRPTYQSRFLEQMIRRRPVTWSSRSIFEWDPVKTFGWVGSSDWMDSPSLWGSFFFFLIKVNNLHYYNLEIYIYIFSNK